MQISVEVIPDRQSASLLSRQQQLRQTFATELARSILERTIEENPIDTGRSRAGWVASLRELGGTAPPGWASSSTDNNAIQDGLGQAHLMHHDDADISEITITNEVDYVGLLERGTNRIPAARMVAKAIADTASRLVTIWNQAIRNGS
ncbi:hypothetical protein [Calycomorphotria hydatis]|uniref:Uncharacterized protein n=1 Tax=Calycomorphotria hydatis TaxID=2528027 RepID=A0A517TFB3_9PLAN|nr:hypothetical protein [Calycomorphotria hydatis]QDT67066.1 hypothetical protein V22_43380 [Calycomorphotria hydatis]